MSSIDYGHEQFWKAVTGMAESTRTLRYRLCDAYVNNIAQVKDENVPEGSRSDLAKLRHMLTHKPARHSHEAACQSTIDQMTDDEAHEAARLIMKLFDEIDSHYREEHR